MRIPIHRLTVILLILALQATPFSRDTAAADPGGMLRAGAFAIDITPTNFPVIVNAMFEERTATQAHDPLHSRSLALDNGAERLVITVVDTCMMPRDLIDRAKAVASKATGLPTDRMLVSANHTHSAPAAMGCLGSRQDKAYADYLTERIAEGIGRAIERLAPARIGWGSIADAEHTFCRRWIRRPDRMLSDPFGEQNVRAHMHPGHENPDAIGPSGPVDPELSVLAVQTRDGAPLALLANYSMHYYESPLLSADYFGAFAIEIAKQVGADGKDLPFVGIMSQGTSGDQMWMNYGQPPNKIGFEAYGREIADVAAKVYRRIEFQDRVPLAMRESKVNLGFRLPSESRLDWARTIVSKMRDVVPRGMAEIYANEALYLAARPTAELILQAIRIGDLGITAIPNEVYAITGLKIKEQSPLASTFNIELANGAEGYIPPPEQHRLGGYTTWPARTAGLETNAEPRIVETVLHLLEEVSGKRRRPFIENNGDYAKAVLKSEPVSYWRLNEINGPVARDATDHGRTARYVGNVAFYLDGPVSPGFSGSRTNRAPHFAGGKLDAGSVFRGDTYSLDLWFWNGLPADARPITGDLFSLVANGDRLSLGGTSDSPGRLVFASGQPGGGTVSGPSLIPVKTWNHVTLVRQKAKVSVFLNGQIETSADLEPQTSNAQESWLVGGNATDEFNFEGKIDEVAFFDRALPAYEIAALHRAVSGTSNASAESEPARKLSSEPHAPEQSMALLRVKDGFRVQLVAAEPLVASPVAIDWGSDGKLWVVEMADYPMGIDGNMKPGGRVRFLEDTNGDGQFDRSTLFLEGLKFPNGIITWRNGVIVTAAPDIFYAEDTDGDGKADKREVLYTGFKEGNLQLRVNGLRWGLDNWLHCANGWSGGQPRSIKTGQEVNLNGRDVRLKPDDGLIEAESGQSEFGRNRDDWGNWFGCDNSYPLFHFVFEDRYMRRNPHVAATASKRQLFLPANPRVYPRSAGQKRFHSFEQANHFTSACATDFYRDDWLFPRDGGDHVFICEPVHNLVQHLRVREDGVSFSAVRAESEDEPEFLASEDQWFRPVMTRTGPDGALWVVDMYRYMIEHPDWLPPEGRKELEPFYRDGENRGRIYRIIPSGSPESRAPARMDHLSSNELVERLGSSNGWIRDKAQQLLVWRRDESAVAPLEELVRRHSNPRARLQSLCTLDGLHALRPAVIEGALQDSNPAVRRHAVRLAEPFVADSPSLIRAITKLVDDPDAKVRLQLACSIGEWDDPRAGEALARLVIADSQDIHIRAAILSSAPRHFQPIVDAVIRSGGPVSVAFTEPLLTMSLGLKRPDLSAQLLEPALTPADGHFTAAQMHLFAHFLDTLERGNRSIESVLRNVGNASAEGLNTVQKLISSAYVTAGDPAQIVSTRASAVSLLARNTAGRDRDIAQLGRLLEPTTPGEIQTAAVKALARTGEPIVPELFTARWAAHAPAIRSAILDALLGREVWTQDLLRLIEDGRIAAVDLDAARRARLLKHGSETVRARAERLLASTSNPDRRDAIESFRPALGLMGEPSRGKAVFVRLCVACHSLDGVGREIGPNLISVKAHSPEKLMASILDPSGAVEPKFLAYNLTLNGGEELYGLIGDETGNGLVLKLSDGNERNLLRSEIRFIQSTKTSLMPDGLESGMTHQDLADLIRHLRDQPGLD
ncbi:MAG: HEAT repeat domain-containing protein [Verrucomicrobia bacterium]|nr:HEAT repeat domain-containing protein [Verrucomicrobiota bacterium]